MKDHTGCYKGFSQLSRAYYSKVILDFKDDISDQWNSGEKGLQREYRQ